MVTKLLTHIRAVPSFLERHKKYFPPLFFIGGFVFDSLTLTRIDFWLNNLILGTYLLFVAIGIIAINLGANERLPAFILRRREWLIDATQFALGALFSGFVVFYFKSASLATSWFFMLLLMGLFVGNEFFRKHYLSLVFQAGMFFVVLFSFLIFFVPVVLGVMGTRVFLFSGALALGVMVLFVFILSAIVPTRTRGNIRAVFRTTFIICALFNIFYFTNSIPPIPLSLKSLAIYHYVERTEEGYRVLAERRDVWHPGSFFHTTVHLSQGEPLYAFSAVFAPTKLTTTIRHRWEYFDAEKGWVTKSVVPFPIRGGRDDGYRGYSISSQVMPGKWRVSVETERGQVVGRKVFTVELDGADRELVEEVR